MRTKPTTTYSNRTKPATTWGKRLAFLLQESLSFLLLEDGNKIVISPEYAASTTYTNRSKPTTTWA